MSSIKIIKDKVGFGDGVMAITPAQAALCKKNHIPTMRGVLYERDDFGNLLFVHENTVVLGGSINALEKLFGQMATYRPQSLTMKYRDRITMPYSMTDEYSDTWEIEHENESHVCLFGVGTGGCELDISAVHDPDFRQYTLDTTGAESPSFGNWLPFRVSSTNTLDTPDILYGEDNAVERMKYHFRMKIDDENGTYGWFLKEFENGSFSDETDETTGELTTTYENGATITSLWKNAPDLSKDGTEITSADDLENGPAGVGIETMAEVTLHISADDVRSYFVSTGSSEVPRFNSLGLFSGVPRRVEQNKEYYEFYNVRLFSVVNFENIAKRLKTENTFVYRVYTAL